MRQSAECPRIIKRIRSWLTSTLVNALRDPPCERALSVVLTAPWREPADDANIERFRP